MTEYIGTPPDQMLRNMVAPGDTLLVIVTRVNRMGDARWMRVIASVDGEPLDITGYVALVVGAKRDKGGDIYVSGVGMNMPAALVMDLGRVLYSDDYALRVRS